jgi:signal transduction histidine kinase
VTLSFRARISIALVVAAILPVAAAAFLMWATGAGGSGSPGSAIDRVVLIVLILAGFIGLTLALVLTSILLEPLKDFVKAVEQVSDEEKRTRIEVPGEDELALLADRYNRLAGDLDLRDRALDRVRDEITKTDPTIGAARLAELAAVGAKAAFDMTSAQFVLGNPDDLPVTDRVPGEPLEVRAILRLGFEDFGALVGTLAPSRSWKPSDQALLELFVTEIAFAIRNAELIERVERQNGRLRDLDAAKDEFLRGVGHNLQTPLTSIRASAQQLLEERPDQRLELIDEQAGRLSRMVRQLVTVQRLDSGSVKPKSDVLALAPRVTRAWEALGAKGVPFEILDRAPGWLAVTDPDQLDQVLWALLDNAVSHGGKTPVQVRIAAETGAAESGSATASRLLLTVADNGPGIPDADRERLFGRYEQLGGADQRGGTGLGLYVSRELCRAMGGDLVLEPAATPAPKGRGKAKSQAPSLTGAAFTVSLPAEPPTGE